MAMPEKTMAGSAVSRIPARINEEAGVGAV